MRTRLLLVDDHAVFRDFAARALASEPDLEVVGGVDSISGALPLLKKLRPDIVLLDYDLHGRNGLELAKAARHDGYRGKFLILAAAIPNSELRDALQQGVSGLVLKEERLERLLAAIRAVAEGRAWFNERCLQLILEPETTTLPFTNREREILRAVAEGLSNKEIATRLDVRETTVKSGVQVLFKKTGVRTRGSLVRVALEKYHDLIAPAVCAAPAHGVLYPHEQDV